MSTTSVCWAFEILSADIPLFLHSFITLYHLHHSTTLDTAFNLSLMFSLKKTRDFIYRQSSARERKKFSVYSVRQLRLICLNTLPSPLSVVHENTLNILDFSRISSDFSRLRLSVFRDGEDVSTFSCMPCERMVSFGFVYLSTEVGWEMRETNTIEEIEFERLRMEKSERRNKNYYSNFELFRVSSVFSCSRVHTFDLHVSVKKCSLLLPPRNSEL